jgi:hypothetical protein
MCNILKNHCSCGGSHVVSSPTYWERNAMEYFRVGSGRWLWRSVALLYICTACTVVANLTIDERFGKLTSCSIDIAHRDPRSHHCLGNPEGE